MLISGSILTAKDLKAAIEQLNQTNLNYIHLDIMDGLFVPNKTWSIDEIKPFMSLVRKPLDIHLMVNDVMKEIDLFRELNPAYITFHLEATKNPFEVIKYIRSLDIKVGISIKPTTPISALKAYLSLVDLVLIMSVEPGMGGQDFIMESENKINELSIIRSSNYYDFIIEVDGGINDETYQYCQKADMLVVGSYLINSDNYQNQIDKIKNFN